MQILARYTTKNVLLSTTWIALLLALLQIFILLVNQINEIGRGDYNFIAALRFVLLQTPYQVYLFFPVVSMLGSLIGLGMMANYRELVVMRASGVSIMQITVIVLKISLLVILIITCIGEILVPHWTINSKLAKSQALSGGQIIQVTQGVWMRDTANYIYIGTITGSEDLQNVIQFHLNQQHALQWVRSIAHAHYQDGSWQALDVQETMLCKLNAIPRKIAHMPWHITINPEYLQLSRAMPDEMTLAELYKTIKLQHKNHQRANSLEIAFWLRLIQPLSTAVMMLLAIPFIFGPLRSSTMGAKFLLGTGVGFSFHILNHLFSSLSQVAAWPPFISAVTPTVCFALLGIYFMLRVIG